MDTRRVHVLVVDDVADIAESTADLLALWGYDAVPCTSGAQALACARIRPPGIVILDLCMPRMSGFRFAEAFRALPGCALVPLLVVSGYTVPAVTERAREMGIAHYLLKPADPDRLRAVLVQMSPDPAGAIASPVGARRGPRSRRYRRCRARFERLFVAAQIDTPRREKIA